jgi:uncharacterized protein YdiU (UPF0061 family)
MQMNPRNGWKVLMIDFNNTYENLPKKFYAKVEPERTTNSVLLAFNHELAEELGLRLETFNSNELAKLFTGQILPESACSIALAYAGHQFGHFSPQLGDGRAILLGEIVTPKKDRFDIQLKGSGPTPFSRNGDGKSSLGPVVREYIVSEAMHFLGVPTTRALAATSTGDVVYREDVLSGAIFTRVASSHIRIGTFEYFAAQGDAKAVKQLVDYSINRHYPKIKEDENIYLSFLKEIAYAQANMVAHWMSFGFIHGVMNTDNMSISGETIDYGPCAFIDNFSFNKVFSSIDHHGRYAFNNQITIAKWNLYKLASCLIPLVHHNHEEAIKIIENSINFYSHIYDKASLDMMRKKIGLFNEEDGDQDLINSFLQYLQDEDLDYTLNFRKLSEPSKEVKGNNGFYSKWQERLKRQPQSFEKSKTLMNSKNPVFIPRNHQVDRAIKSAIEGDFSVFRELNQLLKNPYIEQDDFKAYKEAPKPEERIKATFCGT